ncbi:MAG: hypothetical protein KAT65_08090 [Methanophagales archaeon]|nr:hypothetical protein [Methanophagales archaeon]
MILDPSKKDELQESINNLITTDFVWCKEQIIRSRELVPIEDAELWMRYRNAMDRLLLVQRGINFGEFPSPNSLNEDIGAENIEEVGLTDSSNPDDILQYSEYLFRNCGVEAWVQAAETLIGLLNIRINSFSYHGDVAKANSFLKKALELQADARLARSSSHMVAVSYYKKSTKEAQSGLDLLEKINPYTRGSFWIGIGILLIAAVSLIRIAIGL